MVVPIHSNSVLFRTTANIRIDGNTFFFIKKSKFSLKGRIKKIMQSDEEVGKVAQAVPIIIYILFDVYVLMA